MMAKDYPASFEPAQVLPSGSCRGPRCCGKPMNDDGDCGMGCCDDYKCSVCGFRTRVEWPD